MQLSITNVHLRLVTTKHLIYTLILISTLAHAQSNLSMKPATTDNTSSKRTALLIGNATYTNATSLRNPLNDARAMGEALRSLGFEVTQRTNLDRANLEVVINDWGKTLSKYEVALFYYAGHGTEADGVNYLMPTDANPQSQVPRRFTHGMIVEAGAGNTQQITLLTNTQVSITGFDKLPSVIT